ncbi:MAG: hypothetical protein HRU78_02240 [Gammaproteobacteria bacterium]|nr:MAG: hypothetical protein HRU78_02240 [Gammaproteobacteria bacterium]
MAKPPATNKGHTMEEALRNYFVRAGYYVVRGVPFIYEGLNVTDIDLWLYGRSSSVNREITIVDIKNKNTPKAIERIFWVQGLRQATRATTAIVATTERRQEVKNFGRDLGVLVLDGAFLSKLTKSDDQHVAHRLTEEEFTKLINEYTLEKLDGGWKERIQSCKSLLARNLSFDACNEWLSHAHFFAEQSITKPTQRETALRCFYLICSFVAVAIDFLLKELSFLDQTERSVLIKDGFTYGSKGSVGMKRVLNVAMGLVEQHATEGALISKQVRTSVEKHLSALNTVILGEYFSKQDVAKSLFTVAKELEQLSMNRVFSPHSSASIELRGLLSCFLDYLDIDRVMFSENLRDA